ncbi:MAG: alkylhydroperoxidase [Alcanivoracaceae bacterium]|nr:alkylhydroperoxidase [Alcanivoracaceae bacterium]
MSWIKTIKYAEADKNLLKLYNQVKGPDNNVDNIMMAHSLRPHTMQGHMTLYKYTLHHPKNTVDKWFLECVGVYVSILNGCQYCVDHHFSGMCRLMNDQQKADIIKAELKSGEYQLLNPKQVSALSYVHKLTVEPAKLDQSYIQNMRDTGWGDGEILEINQVASYFNYANRTVLGLGVSIVGDDIGLSPNNSDDLNDWNHS